MRMFSAAEELDAQRVMVRLRSSPAPALVALFGIVLAFYHRLWLPDLVLIKRDAFRFFLPIKHYLVERLTAGELPQWFPYEALGRPFIAVPVTGVFHPFTLLFLLLPIHEAYRLATLVSCLLAALGAFVLSRMLGVTRAGALLAGVAFALSGYVVSLTENLVYLHSVCLLPWFCAALEKARVSHVGWVVVPGLLWASVFLNGDVQTGYYYGFIALLWVAMRTTGSYQQAALRLIGAGLLAALLAGVQLAPAAGVYFESQRAQPELFHQQALFWSTHPLRLLTMVASPIGGDAHPAEVAHRFFGSPSAGQMVGFWAESLYLGLPVLGLAFLGVRSRRDLRGLALLGGLALLLALGQYGGLYRVLYHVVPLWSAFRYPERLMGVVAFAAAMLAGAGVDALRKGDGRAVAWIAVAGTCVGLGVSLYTEIAARWVAAYFGASEGLASEVTVSAAVGFFFSAGAALAVGMAAAGFKQGWFRTEMLLVVLLAAVTVDLARANLDAYHTGPTELATLTPGFVQGLRRHSGAESPGQFRTWSLYDRVIRYPKSYDQWLDLLGGSSLMVRHALHVEHNAQFRIESIKSYLPGVNAGVPTLMAALSEEAGAGVAARYNVAYLIGRSLHFQRPQFERRVVAYISDYDLALVSNPLPVKPRAYLSLRPERVESPVSMSELLARPDFLMGELDVIESSGSTLPGAATDGDVVVERYEPELVKVRVETSRTAVLVLLDAYAPGWEATLETGEPLPIWRANGLARAVAVPAGSHVVTFTYVTPLLVAGMFCTLGGVIAVVALVIAARWQTASGSPSASSA